jgi:5'-methylthioadenosine phosphorylase
MREELVCGVIGGSGLYQMEGFEEVESVQLSTPFGEPSDAFHVGRLDGVNEINFRANVWGLKRLGVNRVLSVSAVGSMRDEIAPGEFVLVDQFIDRTRHRPDTFFGDGVVAHVMFADPVCEEVRRALLEASRDVDVDVHDGGTYVCMEGPQFSTRAESLLYRSWDVDVIGMTNLQEAKLCREAELCYATVAMATDYDCWHESEEDVTVEAILEVMRVNVAHASELIRRVVPLLGAQRGCPCKDALRYAILTAPERIPAAARDRLGLLIEKYLPT